jgi:hypothetical protein
LSNQDRLAEWHIKRNPKPIPSRAHDWDWHHADYDGAPDSGDHRCGTAKSRADAISQIEEITSPPQGQPQRVRLLPLLRDTLGFVLLTGFLIALVTLAADFMGLFE